VNDTAAGLLHRAAAELVGRPIGAEFPIAEQAGDFVPFERALAEQQSVTFEVFLPKLNSWLEVRVTPVQVGLAATLRDVSDRKRVEILTAGNREVLTRIAENAPLHHVLDAVVAMVERQSQHGALASILLISEDGLRLEHGSAPSLPDEYNAAVHGLEIGPRTGSCGTAAYRREQVIVEDIAGDPLWADYRHLALPAGLRSCWSTPVISAAGDLLGTFAIYYAVPRTPGPGDQQLIEQVTRTVAIAIQHDRSRQQLSRAVATAEAAGERSRRLHALAADLAAASTPDEVVRLTVEHACSALDLDKARVTLWTGEADPPSAVAARVPGVGPEGPAPPVRLPLHSGGRPLGELLLHHPRGAFDADEFESAAAIAALCAQALARADDYVRTQQMAETLQRSLLSDAPPTPRFAVQVGYRPAARAAEVGGDWYDAFGLPAGTTSTRRR
jgi:GAF domain-containing protein